jgi:hypothetical protein
MIEGQPVTTGKRWHTRARRIERREEDERLEPYS